MNFQTMEYFLVLAEEKNFTRAAARLYITQQSLSSHIAAVEQELGCKLIVRQVPLGLTFAGETFLRYAANYWNSYLTMKQEFCDIAKNQTGILRVGISYTRSYIFMPDLITNFQQKWPNIEVRVYEDQDLMKQLADGNLDLIITNIKERPPKVEFCNFYEETIVMAVSRELLDSLDLPEATIAKALAEGHLNPLKNCPFVMNESGGLSFCAAQELIRSSDFQPIVKCSLVNIRTILELCLRSVGACFAPESMVCSMLTPEQLSRLAVFPLNSSLRYQIHFGYMKRPYHWSIIDEFIKTALELYPQIINRPVRPL